MRTRPSYVAAAAVLAGGLLLAACSGKSVRAKFPTEEEVRGKIARDMTAEQVLATFGNPPGHQWVDVKLGGKVHYIAPPATRTRKEMGYAGFTVYFDRGRVWDWEVILSNPSYEHRLLPAGLRSWQAQVLGVVFLIACAYGAVRFARSRFGLRTELRQAYAAHAIPTTELPPDFKFLTHDATLQNVLDRAGAPSRVGSLRLENSGSVSVFRYELPNDAALFVMPDPPGQPESRIRAVVYQRSR